MSQTAITPPETEPASTTIPPAPPPVPRTTHFPELFKLLQHQDVAQTTVDHTRDSLLRAALDMLSEEQRLSLWEDHAADTYAELAEQLSESVEPEDENAAASVEDDD